MDTDGLGARARRGTACRAHSVHSVHDLPPKPYNILITLPDPSDPSDPSDPTPYSPLQRAAQEGGAGDHVRDPVGGGGFCIAGIDQNSYGEAGILAGLHIAFAVANDPGLG